MSTVFWITGLSGAGKTTIGQLFYEKMKKENPSVVFLDGDILRRVFGDDLGYSEEDRRKCAMRYSRICKMLSEQGITVIICTISMFHSVREWNRENIQDYKEIYIKVSMNTLVERDQKGLYSRTTTEQDTTVSGVDFVFEEPRLPDLIIENDCGRTPEYQMEIIWNCCVEKVSSNNT